MKRRKAVILALALSLLPLFVGSDGAVQAQPVGIRVADTGIVSIGPGQLLRITVASRSLDEARVRFRRLDYSQGGCTEGVCALSIASLSTSDPMTLAPGEGFSIDIGTSERVRVTVISDRRDLRINAHVVDATTGQIVAVCTT